MSDYKFWDVFRDPLWLRHNFMNKYKHIRVPPNAGWLTSNITSTTDQAPFYLNMYTSVTANSRALAYSRVCGLNSGTLLSYYIDWTKRLEISFILSRDSSDTEAVARIQLKSINTEGVLAAMGIGLQISNFTMVGEAYGTARQTTGTLKTLVTGRTIRIKIVLTSSSVEFWVDGVLVESLTGTAVPAAASAITNYLVVSIINGATGGVLAGITISNIEVVQAW